MDLPQFIEAEENETRTALLRFRVTSSEKETVALKAREKGFKTVSDYIRHLALR